MDRITGEIDDIEQLNELSWPVELINNYKKILDDQFDKVKDLATKGEMNKQLKEKEKELRELKNKVKSLQLNKNLEIFRGNIIKNISELLELFETPEDISLDDIINEENKIIEEINDLELMSKENNNSLYGNDIYWGVNELNIDTMKDIADIAKLYKIILEYSNNCELVQKLLNKLNDHKEKMRYGTEIEKLQLNDLLKYIYSFKDEHLGEKDKKTIYSLLSPIND
jgi:hypothetical protein